MRGMEGLKWGVVWGVMRAAIRGVMWEVMEGCDGGVCWRGC